MGITAAVVVGGGAVRAPLRPYDLVVTADSGLDEARAAGFVPTHLVGDLDSISDDGRAWASEHGVPVERHPVDKDATDTTLALRLAVRLGAAEVDLYGATGVTRLDHLLATVAALGDPLLHEVVLLTAYLDDTTVRVLHPGHQVAFDLPSGALFSLLPMHGRCDGVSVSGATWPLSRTRLSPSSTLGVSNTALGGRVVVSCAGGVLTVVVPGAHEGDR